MNTYILALNSVSEICVVINSVTRQALPNKATYTVVISRTSETYAIRHLVNHQALLYLGESNLALSRISAM